MKWSHKHIKEETSKITDKIKIIQQHY